MKEQSLRITEIFYSLQGESHTVGLPTVFIRLTGCPLRCVYCDTDYAFNGGKKWTLTDILEKVKSYGAKYITVTGGEPLAQPNCHKLLSLLCDSGFQVSLETSGALSIADIDKRVMVVMDLKTPSSRESEKNLYDNISHLKETDQVKFVIGDRADYDWSKAVIDERKLTGVCSVLFSPSFGEQSLRDLADWILKDKLDVRMQVQLHKIIWGDEKGR